MPIHIEDKKNLQQRLMDFSFSDDEKYEVTRIEAIYLANLINKDWRM